MNCTRLLTLGLASLLAVAMGVEGAFSGTLEYPIQTWTVISDGNDDSRLLIDIRDLSDLEGHSVLYAKLFLTVIADTCVETVWHATVAPIATAWSAESVEWEFPWDSAGGDTVEKFAQTLSVRAGAQQEVEIVLTEIIRAWGAAWIEENGLMLIPIIPGCNLTLQSNTDYAGSGVGVLRIRTTGASQ